MELLAVLIGLLFLASPILAIIALLKVNGLKRDIAQLRRDIQNAARLRNADSSGVKPKPVKTSVKQPARAAALETPSKQVKAPLPKSFNPQPSNVPPDVPLEKTKRQAPLVETAKATTIKSSEVEPKRLKVKPKVSLEEMIGSQWSVWVGGVALAIGAVFLLRFSIEAGVFSPAMRMGLAAALGAAGLIGGEWLRRKDHDISKVKTVDITFIQQAYIPGVLTAFGIFTWLGTIYASHAIYEFFGPGIAFVLLGLTSLLGLALGLLHGPKVAALGLLAAFVTPLLVGASEPNYIALYGYLLLIAGAALALAHKRHWPEITVMALFGLLGWSFLSMGALEQAFSTVLWAGFTAFSYGVATWATQQLEGRAITPDAVNKPTVSMRFNSQVFMVWTILLAGIIMTSLVYSSTGSEIQKTWIALSLSALFGLNGARWRGANIHILIGGGLAILTLLIGPLSWGLSLLVMTITSLSIWGFCLRESRFVQSDGLSVTLDANIWVVASVGMPLIGWIFILLKHGGEAVTSGWLRLSDIGPMEGLIYLLLAALFAGTAEYLWRKNERKSQPINIYALGSGAAVLCAIFFCLNIDVRFYACLLSASIGIGLYLIRPVNALRLMIPSAIILASFIAIFHHIQGNDVGQSYIFNALWIYLALPLTLSFVGAKVLERRHSDIWAEGLKALALSLGALFTVMQIHHLMNGGQVLATSLSLEETALFVLTGLCFTFGGSWMERDVKTPLKDRPSHKKLFPFLSIGLSLVTLTVFMLIVCLVMNPLFNGVYEVKGNIVLNSLLLAYGLPSILLCAIVIWARHSRPALYIRGAAGLGFVAFMLYTTSMVRFIFTGRKIDIFTSAPNGLELYAISALWLVIGIGMLVIGLKRGHRDLRIVSGVIIILTILKAFLIDMASLEGVLRAMSFVILGLVLIVIGRVYQKLLFQDKANSFPDNGVADG